MGFKPFRPGRVGTRFKLQSKKFGTYRLQQILRMWDDDEYHLNTEAAEPYIRSIRSYCKFQLPVVSDLQDQRGDDRNLQDSGSAQSGTARCNSYTAQPYPPTTTN